MEVEKSAARAAEIANELTVFSRQEKEAHRAPPGNLNMVVSRCVDFFRNEHGDKNRLEDAIGAEIVLGAS